MTVPSDNNAAQRLAEILTAAHDPAACTACLDQLEAYVGAQLAGEPYRARFPALADHLDQCVACAEAYALTYDDLAGALQAVPAARIPTADLSFLEPDSAGPLSPQAVRERRRVGLPELLAGALTQLGTQLQLRFSAALLAAAAPQPGLLLRDVGERLPLAELLLDQPSPAISRLELRVYQAAHDPATRELRVRLELPERDWPDLAGVTVQLAGPAFREELTTDAWGEAFSADLPAEALDQLVLTVREPTATS